MKTIMVTGTSTGIGFATAVALARAGHDVFATMRDPARSPELQALATKENLAITIVPLDVDSDASVTNGIARIQEMRGRVDVLVNNAGIGQVGSVEEMPLEEYRHVSVGTVASYGVAKGAANIKGIKMTNLFAWLAHRSYHVYAMPTLNRKARIVIGWVTGAVSGRDATSLIKETDPRQNFVEVAKG